MWPQTSSVHLTNPDKEPRFSRSGVITAPAKINLFLKVLERLPSGYHAIASLITPITLADYITLQISSGTGVKVETTFIPALRSHLQIYYTAEKLAELELQLASANNFALLAAESFLQAANLQEKVQVLIKVEKQIPLGAGLGGGSADAQGVLTLLNQLTGTCYANNLSEEDLCDIARQIGTDVPPMLTGQPGFIFAEKGEFLPANQAAIKSLARRLRDYSFVMIKPPWESATGAAYKNLRLPLSATEDLSLQAILSRHSYLRALLSDFSLAIVSSGHEAENFELTSDPSPSKGPPLLKPSSNDFWSYLVGELADFSVIDYSKIITALTDLGAAGYFPSGSGSAVIGAFLKPGALKKDRHTVSHSLASGANHQANYSADNAVDNSMTGDKGRKRERSLKKELEIKLGQGYYIKEFSPLLILAG